MKEWPDAITMFSREENALEASMEKEKEEATIANYVKTDFFV